MQNVRLLLLLTVSFTLLSVSAARKDRSRRRNKKAMLSDHDNHLADRTHAFIELLQESDIPGVTQVNENTWKFKTKSAPIKTSQTSTSKALEELNRSGDLSISFEVRAGSKRKSSLFRAFANSSTGSIFTWLHITLDSSTNNLITQYKTTSLSSDFVEFHLPVPSYRSWIKIFVSITSTTTTPRIFCRVGCSEPHNHEFVNGINLALPRDITFELGGNSETKDLSFSGQLRKARLYTPAVRRTPWKCAGDSSEENIENASNQKNHRLQADEARPAVRDTSLDVGTDYGRMIEELRAEIQLCKSSNKQMSTMMQMMKQNQKSLEERIAALETCECIPMCVMKDGVKRRHGEIWPIGNCTTCECTSGDTSCRETEGCKDEDDACSSNPCTNDGLCEANGQSYSCTCRRGFYGERCEFVDKCIRGVCQNGGACERLDDGGYNCRCREGFTGTNCEGLLELDHCASQPCLNSAKCVSVATGYICTCTDGFKGRRCQDRDDCYSSPCLNRGVCTSLPFGGYSCRCRTGYFGTNCEIRDGCLSSPCLNGGLCRRGTESYSFTCQCLKDFFGPRCEQRNPCHSNPCLNGGKCTSEPLDATNFICECVSGFHGPQCEAVLNLDQCMSDPCLNGGRCIEEPAGGESYTCECLEGFRGPQCEAVLNLGQCRSDPCLNGGRCINEPSGGESYTCECVSGFRGPQCEAVLNLDLCRSAPCSNGGRCINEPSGGESYTCECLEGFRGPQCEDVSPCHQDPCFNGGRCVIEPDDSTSFTCECLEGFVGTNCEDQDYCHSNPCLNGGRCINEPQNGNNFTCECLRGFIGTNCGDRDHCLSTPCLNGGRCENLESLRTGLQFTCRCLDTFIGPRCELRDSCYSSPCLNGGQCILSSTTGDDGNLQYTCRCTDEFFGDNCERQSLCAVNPCLNGGVCETTEDGFYCRCRATHYGERCENTDFCRARPCKNGATCINRPSTYQQPYTCRCIGAYIGPNCEHLDLCQRRPCLNGGTCSMEDGEYICSCPDSYYGHRCENMDFCRENPCLNGGRCENEVSRPGFRCLCPDTHTGNRCQDRHPCRPNPCLNNGRCRVIGRGSFACECPASRTGPRCRLVDHCYNNPCSNGGSCVNDGNGYHCDCRDGFTGVTCEESAPCASNPCMNGATCVEESGRYRCVCPSTHSGTRCQYASNVCSYDKEQGQCDVGEEQREIRWYFDKHTQRCQHFQYSGCGGNGNNFATRQACRQKCLVGACCMIRRPATINGHSSNRVSYDCQEITIGQCKRMDTQRNEIQVISFKSGVNCEDYNCGSPSKCQFAGREYLENTRINAGCRQSCICRKGKMQCRCDEKSMRREIRRLTTGERTAFQNAVRELKMTNIEQGRNVWDTMRDHYSKSLPISQSSKYFLLWNRAFLRKMELELQKIDCNVTIPYYDFTQDAGRFNESIIWQPNFFGGDEECVPDHPFRTIENREGYPWVPCITRNFNPSVSIPSMLDIASTLSSRSYEQLSTKLLSLVSYVNAFIGGDMAISTRAYDPLFYSVYAFVDHIFMEWQKKNPGTTHLSHVRELEHIPFEMATDDLWDGACVEYAAWNQRVACNRSDISPEKFSAEGYNLQGYNRQGFDRDGYDKDGYNALGRDRYGRVDNRGLYKYDGYNAEGYDRTGYDRRGFNRFGFNKQGRDRDGIDIQGFDEAGFNRYGLNAAGFDRRGFNLYGVDRYGRIDTEGHYDEETGYNDCCFRRDGLTPASYDRFGFNVEGLDEQSCGYFFYGPHTLYYREKLWEMLSPQRSSFLSSIARTCGALDGLPRSQASLNWPGSSSSPTRIGSVARENSPDSESNNAVFTERYCFDVDMFLTWCPCLEDNYPAICAVNPCADAHCSLHPTARCVINMCGRSCTAEFVLDGRRVNCHNPCDPNPCQNGGTCVPSRFSSSAELFQCQCTDEFVGSLCEKQAPDTCTLPKRVGTCQTTIRRWFFNFQTMSCEEFLYTGCGGNSNNFASKKACDLRCSLGACCYRIPRNSTFFVGFDKDGYDKYGFNALGFNRRGHRQSSHDSMPTGNRINPPKGFGHDGFDIYGFDKNGFDRQGYGRNGYHRNTGFNRTGYNPSGQFDQQREYGSTGYDSSGRDRAGYTCSGIDRDGFNQLGLYYDFEYHCQSLHLDECEALRDPDQLEVPFEVISFTPGSSCDEVQCGEECGCKIDDRIYKFGETFQHGCETCTCSLGGVVDCMCRRLGRRREIRDLTESEREAYAAAIRKMYESNKWEYATQHAQYIPKSNGVPTSLPWHRYFLRKIEQQIQEHSNCEVFIPYFDWTIDVGKLEDSQVWQASYFGGDGDEDTNCVKHHPFMQGNVQWHPCIKRKFNKTISLPDAVNFHLLLEEPNYENFRLQLEMMSALFHLYVGGHMASPFSPYDPLYLSHWAFMDHIWDEWQKRNPMGISRFPAQHRYVKMVPFMVTPDNVLSSEQQMCVIYIAPTIGSPCNSTDTMKWPPSIRDMNGLDRHGFDEQGYDVNGFNMEGLDRSGRRDTRNMYNNDGFNSQGYNRSGFDGSGWDKYNFNKYNFNRDGFDIEGFDASGYNRYGFDRDGKTPFGMYSNLSFARGYDSGYAASLFDKFGYNKYGFDKSGLNRKGDDAFGFDEDSLDEDSCDNYYDGPHYMRYFYHAQQQLSGLQPEMLKNIKRICSPITPVPDYWFANLWLDKKSKARKLEENWNSQHGFDRTWTPRSSSVTAELLWLPITPDQQFCFNLNWYSGCPLGAKLAQCTENKCAKSSCASHPHAQCRMKNCGACYPEFYNGETGEVYECFGCVSMEGDMHNEGSTWQEGCNTCVCQAGLISCSPKPCPSHSCTHPAPGSDGCCDVCDSCEYESRVYRNRQRFKPNACEMCQCISGTVMCQNINVDCPSVDCDRPIKLPGQCCPTCSTDCRGHRNLQSWAMDKCHNCSCMANRIVCLKNPCPVVQCEHPRISAGECCPECMGCDYKQKKYRHLQNFMENSCNQCSCRFGTVSCTTQQCPPLNCKYKERPPGSCCYRCRRGCEYQGTFYDNGTPFKSQTNPCLECSCQEGKAVCSNMRCPRVSCSRPVVPRGQCCAQCMTCRNGDRIYNEGQTWRSNDGCKTCTCRQGQGECRHILPCRNQCTYGPIQPGQCCPDCSKCAYHGKIFSHLEPFADPHDVCKACSCQAGEVTCSTIRCPEVRCSTVETPAGECCPRCKSCPYDGGVKEHGSSWRIPQDPCTTYICSEGTIEYTDEKCENPRCDSPSTPEGSCCPRCDGCFYRGRNYRNRESIESSRSCTTCTCERGNVVCRRKSCPVIKCRNPVKKTGECCYSCETCTLDGQTYDDGDIFLAPRNPCKNCTCAGGVARCERIDLRCSRSHSCRNPGRSRDQCCPSCHFCEYERRNYRNGETFKPDSTNPCIECTCQSGTVECRTENCTDVTCPNPIRSSSKCCPVCEECQHNGRTYSNHEMWRADSCTDCSCSAGNVQCNPISCPRTACMHPAKAPGECCPQCVNCLYNDKVYSDGSEFPNESDPCLVCTCRAGTVSCIRRTCPRLDCSNSKIRSGECCPTCSTDCELLGRSILNGATVQHPTENCKQCTCSDGSVACRTRVCPTNPGCTHPSNGSCCRDQCTDCIFHERTIRNGLTVQTRNPCRKCTCTNGSMVCISQRCTRATRCNGPKKECRRKRRQCRHQGTKMEHGTQSTIGCKVCSCFNSNVTCQPVKCPSVGCAHPTMHECCHSCDHGCSIQSVKYSEGAELMQKHQEKCKVCHCEKGNVICRKKTCEQTTCRNPSSDGCCQVCKGCMYKGLTYEDGTSFADPDSECGECTCEGGNVHCAPKQCDVPCTHPLKPEGECCPRCGGDCLYNDKVYQQDRGMFSLPSDPHQCSICVCRRGSIQCRNKPCAPTNCRHPITDDCGCSSCNGGCLYRGMLRTNGEKFPSPDNDKCSDCYCSNGNVVCGRKTCNPTACTHPSRNQCGCPTCDKCLYFEQTYNDGVSFEDPEDSCNSCHCEDGNVQCRSKDCPALSCSHPAVGRCGCRACNSCSYDGVDHEDGERFEDPANKCNECICQSGQVTCTKIRCPAAVCSSPIVADGECCAKCIGSCHSNGKSYQDGATFTIESDSCSTCSCSSGRISCVRQRCSLMCTHPVAQSQCCPDCSACIYHGKRHEEGERFSPRDNSCAQCACIRGNVICKARECPEPECENPRRVHGKCCPECAKAHTLECVVHGRRQKPGATWTTEIAGACQECVCLENGITSCDKAVCEEECTHPVPHIGKCCGSCDACYYQNQTYRNSMMFHPDECQSCSCSNGNVQCVTKSCQPLSCTADKQVKIPGECCPRCKSCVIGGNVYADNEAWTAPADPCQECHCQNGVVTCAEIRCLKTCQMAVRIPGQCCPVCTGCFNRNKVFQIGEIFNLNPMDPCEVCECQSSPTGAPVMLCRRRQCPSLADCPRSCIRQPRPGYCCPTCDNRPDCGYGRCTEDSIGNHIVPVDNRCFGCDCLVEDTWLCIREQCETLDCAPIKRYTPQGSCCPVCDECHLERENIDVPTGKVWKRSACEVCRCDRGTIKCMQEECPSTPLHCENGEVPYKKPGQCCSECLNVQAPCNYEGRRISPRHEWKPDSCTKCTCFAGKVDCVTQKCRMLMCRSDQRPMAVPGECCPQCIASPASCVAFGDPHYKTFDGRLVHFQGRCQYLLTADCSQSDFKVFVHNTRNGGRRRVSWTEQVTVITEGGQLTLMKDYSVRLVNGTVLQEFPINLLPFYQIDLVGNYLILKSHTGLQLSWNGRQQRVEVTVPGTYRRRTCGLCGNFNDFPQDDTRLRNSRITSSDAEFGNDWKVNIPNAPICEDAQDINPCDGANYAMRNFANNKCEVLRSSVFAACHTLVNPEMYFATCVYDVCECGENNQACVCDILEAYAAQCRRSGVIVRWRSPSLCNIVCPYDRGYVFDECGSPCKRTCANRNLPPGKIAEQCYMPCVSGCQCPAGKVEHGGRCIYPEHCPADISSSTEEMENLGSAPANPHIRQIYSQPASLPHGNQHSRIVQPPLMAPGVPR